MHPDLLFVVAGIATFIPACGVAVKAYRRTRPNWLAVLLWAMLSAGLLVQGFAPHLQIAHNAFVMTPEMIHAHPSLDPPALIARERHMQILSSVLMISAALGLGFLYRDVFLKPRSPPA